jgi:hypothetical protein
MQFALSISPMMPCCGTVVYMTGVPYRTGTGTAPDWGDPAMGKRLEHFRCWQVVRTRRDDVMLLGLEWKGGSLRLVWWWRLRVAVSILRRLTGCPPLLSARFAALEAVQPS